MAPINFLLALALFVLGSSTTFATGEDDYTRSLCAKANCGTGYVCKIHEGHGRVLKGGGSSGDSSSSNKGHDGNQNEQEQQRAEAEKKKKEADQAKHNSTKYAKCEKASTAADVPPAACPKDYKCAQAGSYCVMAKAENDNDNKFHYYPNCKCAKGCSGDHCEYSNDLCKKCDHDSKCAVKKDKKGNKYAECYCSSKSKYYDDKSHSCMKYKKIKKDSEHEKEHKSEHKSESKTASKLKKALRGAN